MKRTVTAAALMVGVVACSSASEPASTTSAVVAATTTTTAAETTTTAAEATTTTTIADTTTTTAPGELVGDPELLEAQFDELAAYMPGYYPEWETNPLAAPDFSTPDPVEALKRIFAFDEEVFARYPLTDLTFLYTVDRSPAWELFRSTALKARGANEVVVYESRPGLQVINARVLPEDEALASVTPAILGEAPDGSVAIAFQEDVATYELEDRDTGEASFHQAAGVLDSLAVLSPTDAGWRLFFYRWERIS